jgi:hypothetical protein
MFGSRETKTLIYVKNNFRVRADPFLNSLCITQKLKN